MSERPKTLVYLPLFLIATVVFFPLQVMILFGYSPLEYDAIFASISDVNIFVMGLCLASSVTLFKAATSARYVVPLLISVVAFNNGFVSHVSEDYSVAVALFGTLGFVAAHVPFYKGEVQMLFDHPEKRWWLTAPRLRREIPMLLNPLNQQTLLKSKTFDISEGGAFIPFSSTLDPLTDLKVNDSMTLRLNLGSLSQLRCQAKVVRIDAAKGLYPAGVGLSFLNLGFKDKIKLRRYVSSQRFALATI